VAEVVRAAPTVDVMVHAGVPRDAVERPLGRLFLLLCERYDLDPALRQVEVIPGKGNRGPQVYITADGYRHIALASGQLDGITIDSSEGGNGWRAFVTVWRKGCAHGFDGRAGCGFAEGKEDPEAQAITRATRRALRNAFDPIRVDPQFAPYLRDSDLDDEDAPGPQAGRIGGPGVSSPGSADDPQPSPTSRGASSVAGGDASGSAAFDDARQAAAREAFGRLSDRSRQLFRRRHRIAQIDAPWPAGALWELLGPPAPEQTDPGVGDTFAAGGMRDEDAEPWQQ